MRTQLASDLVPRYIDIFERVVVAWGFVVPFLSSVIELKKQGAKLIWFDTPDEIAFPAYVKRWGDSPRVRRLWELERDWQIRAGLPTGQFQIVETSRPDGSFRPHEELDKEILGY